MENIVLRVQGMSCEHCVKAVTNAISAFPGVENVKIDLSKGTAVFDRDPAVANLDDIIFEIEDQGYDVVS